jgi:hypothetical protein
MHVETVVCFNRTTGETAPGTVSSGNGMAQFECDAAGVGEMGILLLGEGTGDATGPGPKCTTITEQEPNNKEWQELGTLPAGGCVTVQGRIEIKKDVDSYLLLLARSGQLRLTATSADGPLGLVIWDARTGEDLAFQCQENTCEVTAPTDAIGRAFSAEQRNSYTIKIAAGGGTGDTRRSADVGTREPLVEAFRPGRRH